MRDAHPFMTKAMRYLTFRHAEHPSITHFIRVTCVADKNNNSSQELLFEGHLNLKHYNFPAPEEMIE